MRPDLILIGQVSQQGRSQMRSHLKEPLLEQEHSIAKEPPFEEEHYDIEEQNSIAKQEQQDRAMTNSSGRRAQVVSVQNWLHQRGTPSQQKHLVDQV